MTHRNQRSVRCAVYTRTCTDDGMDRLEVQRQSAEAYIRSREDWTCLPGRYDDIGFSGRSMERPALGRLLAAIEAHEIDIVVVSSIDRLTRSLPDLARIMDVFDRNDAFFISVAPAGNGGRP